MSGGHIKREESGAGGAVPGASAEEPGTHPDRLPGPAGGGGRGTAPVAEGRRGHLPGGQKPPAAPGPAADGADNAAGVAGGARWRWHSATARSQRPQKWSWISPKDTRGSPSRGGLLGKTPITPAQVTALANLPPKETVLGQVLGTINAPASQVVGVVASGIRQVLNVLQAYVDKLEGKTAPQAA
jgi:hypothetical protein